MPSTFDKYFQKPKMYFPGLEIGRYNMGDKADWKILERENAKEC